MKSDISSSELKSLLMTRKDLLEALLLDMQKKLSKAPDGTLVVSKSANRTQYYHREKSSDRHGIYLDASKKALAKGLAQKDYEEKVAHAASAEYKVILNCLEKYPVGSPEEVYDQLSAERQQLVDPISEPDEVFADHWKNLVFQKMPVSEDQNSYKLPSGELVRSKSEFIIASLLLKAGIPFRYEYPVRLSALGTVHPDFTVLNTRLRKEFFWEHLGMMGDSEYAENALRKISAYQTDGYFPGESLILTYETRESPFNIDQVTTMINKYLR